MKENSRFKFRAWDYESERWVYGYYTKLVEGIRKYDAIVSEDGGSLVRYYIDDIKTLGQYTGLKDKNGLTCIYEGDIIDGLGNIKGNIYEMDAREADTVIQGFGTKTWCETYRRAILLGCIDSE